MPPGLDFSNLGDSELQSLLNSMNQQQLMQLFGGQTPPPPPPASGVGDPDPDPQDPHVLGSSDPSLSHKCVELTEIMVAINLIFKTEDDVHVGKS